MLNQFRHVHHEVENIAAGREPRGTLVHTFQLDSCQELWDSQKSTAARAVQNLSADEGEQNVVYPYNGISVS